MSYKIHKCLNQKEKWRMENSCIKLRIKFWDPHTLQVTAIGILNYRVLRMVENEQGYLIFFSNLSYNGSLLFTFIPAAKVGTKPINKLTQGIGE